MAVRCYEKDDFGIDVNVMFDRRRIICNAQGSKKGKSIDLGLMKLTVIFMLDDEMIETSVKYKKRKGYIARYNLRKKDFNCISCEIRADDTFIAKGHMCKNDF